ncbi:TIGR03016 family PEP-CTERM system-associated outer membrane protein [Colwellia sp. 6_MG-2023]|uniref:TIGR03016 family PEP-CTERM system-associated outer membrane protein n=1 Tax=Colwellia sp. 6_MG-2023 TaxID=3062676 RepID=UPI0026E2827F|nr:TIGR03016 family PEP-CTERM system-associated outer membrane protein [Colwellia sp. 6_MG-2023]MDO6487724.1 TIGR03016 family PEP-CTERM system-associated outer membrane protein [Colwellia sp. 6_MG-2023]
MAIMAMATVRKANNFHLANVLTLLTCSIFVTPTMAGEWQFVPTFGIEETYTDNVELTITDPTSSLVSQAILGVGVDYQSRFANFSFTGENNNLFFSHDSSIDDNYLTLNSQGSLYLWSDGPEIFATAVVDNTSRNSASNSLADLVSGDTVQSESYATGLRYNVNNSSFALQSAVTYSTSRFEDDIGDYDSESIYINTNNNNNARLVFWQLNSSYSKREQNSLGITRDGKQYSVDAKLGLITPIDLNPFIRFYDEDFSGTFGNQSQPTTSSWGPGFRWLVSQHLQLDLSYNYVTDDEVSDDYVAASIQWDPSARTSLTAGYSQRFFGDSYDLSFQHRTKRLTNTISYDETLEVFDRNSFQQIDLGAFWCPTGSTIANIANCFAQSEQPDDSQFQLTNFFYLEPVESNEFSLNKRFSWNSTLQLARTSFTFSASGTRRESIESEIVDDTLSASFTINRRISGKSKLTLLAKYDNNIYDKNNPAGSRQEDDYRTLSATYTKNLASSLSTHFTLQQVNRDSTVEQYTYDELRAIINVTKEF